MKLSSSSLAVLLLLCATNTSAFTVSTPALSRSRLYSSTLNKPETTDSNLETNDESSILAVSANHVLIDGRITEGSLAKAMPNHVLPLVFEEDNSHEYHTSTAPTTNSHDHTFKHSLSQINNGNGDDGSNSASVNGIKMTMATGSELKAKEDQIEKAKPAPVKLKVVETKSANDSSEGVSFSDRVANSGVASASALAIAAVNAAVAMKALEAPDVSKSYISLDKTQQELDEEGLPLVYDKEAIETYWKKERGALNKRWGYFVGKAVPFLTRITTLFIKDGKIEERYIPELSERARIDLQDLGPTFIKAGQMMSVRPDVLPQVSFDWYGTVLIVLVCSGRVLRVKTDFQSLLFS